jgi:hypothetical protein
VLNTSIVNVALGPLGGQWRLSSPELSWVINAYLLPFGGLLLLGGRGGSPPASTARGSPTERSYSNDMVSGQPL